MKQQLLILTLSLCLLTIFVSYAKAGTTADIGTVPGTPAIGQVNWLAWLDKNIQAGGYPNEVITEDSTSPGFGVDQGYQDFGGTVRWILQVGDAFSNEAPGDAVSILLGGIGASSGTIWEDSFSWTIGEPVTDQGQATESATGSPCPTMSVPSSPSPTINWAAPAGTYHIYRSQQASGAGNGASNGRYQYLATVPTTGANGSYTDSSPGAENWYIVVPADSGTNAINGCHSEEVGPLNVQLANFSATPQSEHIIVEWQTVLELNNLGFNVWRGSSPDAPETQLNASLIPSQAPGSGQGSEYQWEDTSVEAGDTYYYWLEDVDVSGVTTRHGPVSAIATVPTAITLTTTEVSSSRWLPMGVLLLVGASLLSGVGVVVYRRRQR